MSWPSQPGMIGGDTGRPVENSTGPGDAHLELPGRARPAGSEATKSNSSSILSRIGSGPSAISPGSP